MFNNRKQSIPALFQEIMKNQEQRRYLKVSSVIDFKAYRSVYHEMARFRHAANEFLQRKGNTSGKI